MFRLGGGGGGGVWLFPVSSSLVDVSQKFCIGVDHHSVSSNIKKHLHKINDVIDNELISLF